MENETLLSLSSSLTFLPIPSYPAIVFRSKQTLTPDSNMLPRKIIVRKTRWIWVAFLLLSPLAYLAGVYIIFKDDPSAKIGVSIDRDIAISSAAQYAEIKGVNVTGWDSFCRFLPEDNLLFYYRLKTGAEKATSQLLAPEAAFAVRFRSQDRRENIEIFLDVNGRPLGYLRNLSKSIQFVDQGEEVSRKLAEEAIRARLRTAAIDHPVQLTPGEVSIESGESGEVRKYNWRWPLSSLPELNLQSVISVRGDTIVGDQLKAKIDESYAKKSLGSASIVRLVSIIVYGLVVLIVVIFGVYRFVRRTRQREISYSRVFLLALILSVVSSSFVIVTDVATYDTAAIPDSRVPDWVILSTASMFYLMLGLFLGLAYGSGEGDIREAYPGKLSSLDALMTGRFFSRNVARSVVTGWAFGGWMLFCSNAVLLPWLRNPANGEGFGPLDAWVGRLPWLLAFTWWPVDVILVIVIGLLIPLPLLYRRFGYSKFTLSFLSVFTWVACAGPYLNFRPYAALLSMAAIRTFFTMLAFFRFDLLTAIVALATPGFIGFTAQLLAQPSSTLRTSGILSLSIALIVLAVEVIFAFKGRLYLEDEVRPVYAKNLAERLSMQAEVQAAREAQRRLMQNELPRADRFSVAAMCIPAFEVGGDFYDLFEIEPGRMGVFIAEGGGKGLGSALSIAFAKGYLMPKIFGKAASDNSPSEVVRGLQDRLMMTLGEESNLGIAYAIIDANDGSLRYARTAKHPVVLVKRAGKITCPDEHELKFHSNLTANEDVRLIEGSLSIDSGDSIVFFTDGIDKDWTNNGTSAEIVFDRVLNNSRNGSVEDLRESLKKAVNECSKHARKKGVEDDLTAVVVRVEKPGTDGEIILDRG